MSEAQAITLLIAVLCIEWKVWRPIGDWLDRKGSGPIEAIEDKKHTGFTITTTDNTRCLVEHSWDVAARLAAQRAAMITPHVTGWPGTVWNPATYTMHTTSDTRET